MIRYTHTNEPNSGFYVDNNNQLVLFDHSELPVQVIPSRIKHPHDRQLKREVVQKYITKRYGI